MNPCLKHVYLATGKRSKIAVSVIRYCSFNLFMKATPSLFHHGLQLCYFRQRTHRTQNNGNRPMSIPSSYPNKSGHDALVQSYDHTKIHEEEMYNRNLSLIRLPFYDHISQILPPTILSEYDTINPDCLLVFGLATVESQVLECKTKRNYSLSSSVIPQ